ncbi:MAG: holdfast anchor protein HfaD, partial [Pseudomonadota bacterium]
NVFSAANYAGGYMPFSDQDMEGSATAISTMTGGLVAGQAVATSTAGANSYRLETHGGNADTWFAQTNSGDEVRAETKIQLDTVNSIGSSASATSNNAAIYVYDGDTIVDAVQSSSSDVTAANTIQAGLVDGDTVAATTSVANSYFSWSGQSQVATSIEQSNDGAFVSATTRLVQTAGDEIAAASTASGNSIAIDNEFGDVFVTADQENNADVNAETIVALDEWIGTASASAYGVGNSTLITNIGADAETNTVQTNTGDVSATVSLTGASSANGSAHLGTTAIGNAYTGFVCAECGDAQLTGSIYQSNGASVSSVGTITAPRTGGVYGTASAIGNTASFTTAIPSSGH